MDKTLYKLNYLSLKQQYGGMEAPVKTEIEFDPELVKHIRFAFGIYKNIINSIGIFSHEMSSNSTVSLLKNTYDKYSRLCIFVQQNGIDCKIFNLYDTIEKIEDKLFKLPELFETVSAQLESIVRYNQHYLNVDQVELELVDKLKIINRAVFKEVDEIEKQIRTECQELKKADELNNKREEDDEVVYFPKQFSNELTIKLAAKLEQKRFLSNDMKYGIYLYSFGSGPESFQKNFQSNLIKSFLYKQVFQSQEDLKRILRKSKKKCLYNFSPTDIEQDIINSLVVASGSIKRNDFTPFFDNDKADYINGHEEIALYAARLAVCKRDLTELDLYKINNETTTELLKGLRFLEKMPIFKKGYVLTNDELKDIM